MANPAKWDCSKMENHMAGARLLSFVHKRIKTSIKSVRKFNTKFNQEKKRALRKIHNVHSPQDICAGHEA